MLPPIFFSSDPISNPNFWSSSASSLLSSMSPSKILQSVYLIQVLVSKVVEIHHELSKSSARCQSKQVNEKTTMNLTYQ